MIKMLFDEFDKGKLDFKRITTKSKNESSSRPLFLFENEFYICEEFVIEYYKSKGYDAFFSENSTWSKLIKILLKDIFKEFKKIRKEKKYKVGFYDYAEIEELEYEFLQKGALNKSLSDNPILSAAKIMNSN